MKNQDIDLRLTGISSKNFTQPTINYFNNYQTSFRFESNADENVVALRKILKRLSKNVSAGKGAC